MAPSPVPRPFSGKARITASCSPSIRSTPPAVCSGNPCSVITEDDEGNQDEAVSVVKKLIDLDGVCGILGEVASTRSLAGGGVCEQEHVPMISPSSTNPDVTKDRKYVFRVCFTDDFQGSVGRAICRQKGMEESRDPFQRQFRLQQKAFLLF